MGETDDRLAPSACSAPSSVVASVNRRARGASAYLKIADGCSASCAFCTIPSIKGPQRSKDQVAIVAEAQQLVEQGVRELVLIAQDTAAYGRDRGQRDALPALISDLLRAAPDLDWLRIMYAYPQRVSPHLIEVMARNPQVCHYLDLPLQHAHPDTLRRMGRPTDIEGAERLIGALRRAMPDIALRTTFIVGYPGETDAEFETLLRFIERIRFAKLGVFVYSPEAGTVAVTLPNPVPKELAEDRRQRAMELQSQISLRCNQDQIGRTLDVLIEGSDKGVSIGRCYRDAPEIDGYVILMGHYHAGEMLAATITCASEYDLEGIAQG
jgi:ribosomal protein S12 methylthiotransferase